LAALGILAAFFMALIGLLLAPTLASAEKNSGPGHQHTDESGGNGAPNPIYSGHEGSHESDKITWNAPPPGPCTGQSCGHQDETQYSEDGFSGDGGGFSYEQQDGHGQNGNGLPGSNGGGSSGGFPGGRLAYGGGSSGGYPGGSPGGSSGRPNTHNSDSNDSGTHDGDHDGGHDGDHDKPRSDVPETHLTPLDDPYRDPDPESGPTFLAPPPGDGLPEERGSGLDEPTEVPEPLTLSLFAVGLVGSAAMRRRGRNK
jgi:hypothetical protein